MFRKEDLAHLEEDPQLEVKVTNMKFYFSQKVLGLAAEYREATNQAANQFPRGEGCNVGG